MTRVKTYLLEPRWLSLRIDSRERTAHLVHRLAATSKSETANPNLLIHEQSLGIHRTAGSDLLDYLISPAVSRTRTAT